MSKLPLGRLFWKGGDEGIIDRILEEALPALLLSDEDDKIIAIEEVASPAAAALYSLFRDSGVEPEIAAACMLRLGLRVGFQLGHIDGHVCAAEESPDDPEPYTPSGYV